jgi:hypothetical protein
MLWGRRFLEVVAVKMRTSKQVGLSSCLSVVFITFSATEKRTVIGLFFPPAAFPEGDLTLTVAAHSIGGT